MSFFPKKVHGGHYPVSPAMFTALFHCSRSVLLQRGCKVNSAPFCCKEPNLEFPKFLKNATKLKRGCCELPFFSVKSRLHEVPDEDWFVRFGDGLLNSRAKQDRLANQFSSAMDNFLPAFQERICLIREFIT